MIPDGTATVSKPGAPTLVGRRRDNVTEGNVGADAFVRPAALSEDAWDDIRAAVHECVPFSIQHAKTAGSLITQTRPSELSLGDRACLALALELHALSTPQIDPERI